MRLLTINGVSVPLHACLSLSQRYEPVTGQTRTRMASGVLRARVKWLKLRTVIEASGSIPAGLISLDYAAPYTLGCIADQAITSATPTGIALPAARRSDAGSQPFGRAQVMRGDTPEWVPTGLTLAGDTANLDPVAGAVLYQAVYFPELTVMGDPPTERKTGQGPRFAWSLVAEEV